MARFRRYLRAALPPRQYVPLLVSLVLAVGWRPRGQAEILLDGSLGARGPLAGHDYRIPAELGQLRGPNLFHRFRS